MFKEGCWLLLGLSYLLICWIVLLCFRWEDKILVFCKYVDVVWEILFDLLLFCNVLGYGAGS